MYKDYNIYIGFQIHIDKANVKQQRVTDAQLLRKAFIGGSGNWEGGRGARFLFFSKSWKHVPKDLTLMKFDNYATSVGILTLNRCRATAGGEYDE